MLPTITDITNHRLIAILLNDKATTVRKFLHNIPEDKKILIKEVCIDMDSNYLKVIKEELPNAKIVVDFCHIVADVNRRISELGTIIQKTDKVNLPKNYLKNQRNI